MSMPGINIEEFAMPNPTGKTTGSVNPEDYRVRYFKADIDEPSDLAELELIETEALEGKTKVLLKKDSFTFQSSFFVVITFLEKR
ncbi:MAG: hypothetical protein JHC33_02355 [Ignisphaera sp.]|nr:hypothetical protein [Ignisphaera sp.]